MADTGYQTSVFQAWRQAGLRVSRKDPEDNLGSSWNVLYLELRGCLDQCRQFSKVIKLRNLGVIHTIKGKLYLNLKKKSTLFVFIIKVICSC